MKTLYICGFDFDNVSERFDSGREIIYLLRDDFHAEDRSVLSQQHAVTIINQPPGWWQGDQLDPVVLRLGGEMLMTDDLQVSHAANQQTDEQKHQQSGYDCPAVIAAVFPTIVFEFVL